MTLATLVHYGERVRCGVDSVGISNFVTFLRNTEDYRRDLRRVEYGDERDPEMATFLQSISPLENVARIRSPLLVGVLHALDIEPFLVAEVVVDRRDVCARRGADVANRGGLVAPFSKLAASGQQDPLPRIARFRGGIGHF
jgi:peptidoglycan hydrolase-like protein with peptidoglycan-binding domain